MHPDPHPIDIASLLRRVAALEAENERLREHQSQTIPPKAAAAAEDRYQNLFQSVDQGFCILEVIFDATGRAVDYRYLETNAVFERHSGLVDAVGKTVMELVPDIEPRWFDLYGEVALTGESKRILDHSRAIGRWFDVHAFRMGAAELRQVAVLFNDVTARQHAEQALLEAEARLHVNLVERATELERLVVERTADRNALWQLSADVMLRATFNGDIVAANPAWKEVLGWDVDEIVGTNLFDLVHPDDIERTRGGAATLATGSGLARFDNRYRHRDGSHRWISWSARPGDALINAVGRDISVERARDLELRDLEDFSRLALSAVGGVGVWRFDIPTDRFFCDENVARLYAIDPLAGKQGILREDFLANVLPEDLKALRATMAGGLVNSGDLELEYRIRHPDGSIRWVLSRGHTYFDEAGHPLRRTGVGVDMTKQRLLEEQLRQSRKLEAIGQLTGGIAHDFNNLLSTISASLTLMKRRLPSDVPSEIERYLEMSSHAVQSGASLTHRLLAFSRKQTLDIRAVDINQLALDMKELLERSLGERVEMRLALTHGQCLARTDSHQLENALLNLAINARDAMPDGGVLTISTVNLNPAPNALIGRDPPFPPGAHAVLEVTDTGTGMPAEVVSRAFDPFFTTKPIGQGTGLGLSMIYGFVKQSGGDVSIKSMVGFGTTVRILLPRADELTAPVSQMLSALPVPRGSGQHVLVVEDEPDVRRVVVDVLSAYGYRTSEAADARSALALLATEAAFDLLLTDVGLPGMTGRQLADEARQRSPRLKVLLMTGYAKEAVVRGDFLGDEMDMIAKPFAVDDLAERVHALLQR